MAKKITKTQKVNQVICNYVNDYEAVIDGLHKGLLPVHFEDRTQVEDMSNQGMFYPFECIFLKDMPDCALYEIYDWNGPAPITEAYEKWKRNE